MKALTSRSVWLGSLLALTLVFASVTPVGAASPHVVTAIGDLVVGSHLVATDEANKRLWISLVASRSGAQDVPVDVSICQDLLPCEYFAMSAGATLEYVTNAWGQDFAHLQANLSDLGEIDLWFGRMSGGGILQSPAICNARFSHHVIEALSLESEINLAYVNGRIGPYTVEYSACSDFSTHVAIQWSSL